MSSWRAVAVAMVLAVTTTAGIATVVEAEPAPLGGVAAPVDVAGSALVPAQARVSPPPEVTEHPIDPARIPPSAHTGGGSVTQRLRMTVIGGAIEVVSPAVAVVLQREPGSTKDWTGVLPPVRLIDARGTHEGWDVRWTVDSIELLGFAGPGLPDAKVRLQPNEPVVVYGTPDGLVTGKPSPAVPRGRTLFGAKAGSGGGTYEAGGTVSLRLPASRDVDAVVVHLSFKNVGL